MKVAIILVGNLKYWGQTKQSFIDNFNKYNPDVFVHTYDSISENSDEKLSDSEINSMLSDINVIDKIVVDKNTFINQIDEEYKRYFIGDSYEYYLEIISELKSINECYKKINNYDYIIKTRFDILCNLNEYNLFDSTKTNQLFTSNTCNVCTHFVAGYDCNMKYYCNMINNLIYLYNTYFKPDIKITSSIMLYYVLALNCIYYSNDIPIELL